MFWVSRERKIKNKTNKQTKTTTITTKKTKQKNDLCHFPMGGPPVYNRIEINHSSLVDF